MTIVLFFDEYFRGPFEVNGAGDAPVRGHARGAPDEEFPRQRLHQPQPRCVAVGGGASRHRPSHTHRAPPRGARAPQVAIVTETVGVTAAFIIAIRNTSIFKVPEHKRHKFLVGFV